MRRTIISQILTSAGALPAKPKIGSAVIGPNNPLPVLHEGGL